MCERWNGQWQQEILYKTIFRYQTQWDWLWILVLSPQVYKIVYLKRSIDCIYIFSVHTGVLFLLHDALQFRFRHRTPNTNKKQTTQNQPGYLKYLVLRLFEMLNAYVKIWRCVTSFDSAFLLLLVLSSVSEI